MIAFTAQWFVCRIRMFKLATFTLVLSLVSPHPNGKAAGGSIADDIELARRAAGELGNRREASDFGRHSEDSSPDAFTELYHRYLPGIYRYHLARTGHVQEAEDLTAQTFLTALESISSFRGQGSFSSWLFGIASHKLADHYRRIRTELPLEEVQDLPSPAPLPEEATLQRLELTRVAQVLRLISPERAEALVLCIFGGLSLAEAAHSVGKSEAAVKMLVHRGLCDLQERLAIRLEVV